MDKDTGGKRKRGSFRKADEYDVHFPERQIDLGNGLICMMHPMRVKEGKDFLRSFGIIRRAILMRKVPEGEKPMPAAVLGDLNSIIAEQILPMLSVCVDKDLDSLPMTAIPILNQAWLDLNLNDEMLKNCSALEDRINELSERVNDFIGASRSRVDTTS